jgi:hypothetical protein
MCLKLVFGSEVPRTSRVKTRGFDMASPGRSWGLSKTDDECQCDMYMSTSSECPPESRTGVRAPSLASLVACSVLF